MRDLNNKIALVTGASRGLGQAIARRLGSAGALIAVNYASNDDAANQTVSDIKANGGDAFAIKAKLGDANAAGKCVAAFDAELAKRGISPKVDILVNNIGGGDYGAILDADEAFYDQIFNNNVKGPFFLTRALHGHFADNGRIINISSAGSRLVDPGIIVYTMAKAAVEAFTRTLAAELGPRGITVNSIGPGFTAGETNAHIVNDPDAADNVINSTALRRFGTPEEIADAVYMLASPLGRWITAQNIEASGGFML